MRQTSPESIGIFDFIMEVYDRVQGQWQNLVICLYASAEEVKAFVEYAALFLSNLGNYYARFPYLKRWLRY